MMAIVQSQVKLETPTCAMHRAYHFLMHVTICVDRGEKALGSMELRKLKWMKTVD